MAQGGYTIIENENFRFSQEREDLNTESGKLAIFSRSRGGVNNKHFYTVFGFQSLILEWNNRFWDYMQT